LISYVTILLNVQSHKKTILLIIKEVSPMKQLIIKRILPLFMLTLLVFGGFSTSPLTIQKTFAKTTTAAQSAAADQAAADKAAADKAAADQAAADQAAANQAAADQAAADQAAANQAAADQAAADQAAANQAAANQAAADQAAADWAAADQAATDQAAADQAAADYWATIDQAAADQAAADQAAADQAAADQAAADQVAADQAAADQAATPEISAINPMNVTTLTTSIENNSNLIGTLPGEAVSFSLNGKTLNAVVNADVVASAIETLKAKKAENSKITNLILKLPNSTFKDVSGIQLKIPGALAASLNKENITMDFSQDANTVKLQPNAFNTDTYKLFETGKELQIDVATDSQSLPNELMLYDKPTMPLSSVFSVKTTVNDGISAPADISPMNKGITISTTLTDDARNNLSKDAIVTVCSFNPTEKGLVSIPTQYDSEKGIATFNVTASGDYLTASRVVTEGSALSGWFFLIPLALLTLIIGIFFFIWNKQRKPNNNVNPSSGENKNIPADNYADEKVPAKKILQPKKLSPIDLSEIKNYFDDEDK